MMVRARETACFDERAWGACLEVRVGSEERFFCREDSSGPVAFLLVTLRSSGASLLKRGRCSDCRVACARARSPKASDPASTSWSWEALDNSDYVAINNIDSVMSDSYDALTSSGLLFTWLCAFSDPERVSTSSSDAVGDTDDSALSSSLLRGRTLLVLKAKRDIESLRDV